jgi:hypothetical protein
MPTEAAGHQTTRRNFAAAGTLRVVVAADMWVGVGTRADRLEAEVAHQDNISLVASEGPGLEQTAVSAARCHSYPRWVAAAAMHADKKGHVVGHHNLRLH